MCFFLGYFHQRVMKKNYCKNYKNSFFSPFTEDRDLSGKSASITFFCVYLSKAV